MKTATLKTLEQTDNVSLYSICFDGKAITEYEAFLRKFKDDAKLNEDYKKIILALEKIVAVANKLIRQMFAVVTNNRPYIDGYVSTLA